MLWFLFSSVFLSFLLLFHYLWLFPVLYLHLHYLLLFLFYPHLFFSPSLLLLPLHPLFPFSSTIFYFSPTILYLHLHYLLPFLYYLHPFPLLLSFFPLSCAHLGLTKRSWKFQLMVFFFPRRFWLRRQSRGCGFSPTEAATWALWFRIAWYSST